MSNISHDCSCFDLHSKLCCAGLDSQFNYFEKRARILSKTNLKMLHVNATESTNPQFVNTCVLPEKIYKICTPVHLCSPNHITKVTVPQSSFPAIALKEDLQSNIFCGLRYLQRLVAKDIQSRCRNLREMKDVFKELKVLGRKRKSCTSQINKDILETIFT